MRTRTALLQLVMVIAFSMAMIPLHAEAPEDDRKSILGVWSGAMPGDAPGSIVLTITPTKITGRDERARKDLGEGTYQIDPSAKTIDSQGIGGPVKGRTYRGLYSLEGNTLKWVSQSRGKKRPADLVHRPDRDQFLMILERRK